MKRFIKKIIILTIIIITYLTFFGTNEAKALTQKEAGNAVANAAINYMNEYGEETVYRCGESGWKQGRWNTMAYQQKTDGSYWLECTSFVSVAYMRGIGIEKVVDLNPELMVIAPYKEQNYAGYPFELVEGGVSNAQPGDVIVNYHHVMVHIGGGVVIHCDGGGGTESKGAISKETIQNYASRYRENVNNYEVWRIRADVAAQLDATDITPPSGIIDEIKAILNEFVFEKQAVFRKANESDIDKNKEFVYQGIAKLESQTTSTKTDLSNVNPGESLGFFTLTAYCSCAECCGEKDDPSQVGITASGKKARANHTIATDWSVIPKDEVVVINGRNYVAEDTGDAIKGNRIDVYFDSHQEAENFGVKENVEIFKGISADKAENSPVGIDENPTSTITWSFPTLSSILDWILGLITYIIKGVFVGITTIVHVLISYYVDAATGENVADRLNNGMMEYLSSGKMREDLEKSISVEKIVYNQVPILDANIFNGNTAGGKTVDSGSLTMIIRNVVATLYVGIRQLAIIVMLIILIYLGIKLVTSSIAEQKAEYRKKLASWGIAFLIVFGMHYFLIGVMKINEIIVSLLSNIGANFTSKSTDGQYTDLALAMRDLTYNVSLVQSFVATVMYMVLVYFLIKFIIIYFKRLFVTAILIILGPILAIKNAVDKVRFNKSSSMATWAKEYVFSVGTQTIHALIYTIFMAITYTLVLKSEEARIALCILASLFFRFMTRAEKMLRDMLRLAGGQIESIIGDTDNTDIRDLFGFAVFTRINQTANMLGIKKSLAKGYQANKKFFNRYLEAEYVKIKRDEYIKKYKDVYMTDERGRRVKVESHIDEKIDDILKAEYAYKLNKAIGSIKIGTDTVKSVAKIGVGSVILAVGTQKDSLIVGGISLGVGVKTLGIALGKPIKGYRRTATTVRYRTGDETYKNIKKWASVNGTMDVAERLKQQYIYNKDDVTAGNELKVLTLHQARKVELELQEEIADKKETILKGAEPNASPIEKKLAEDYTNDLRKSVQDTMKTVDRKDIHKEVKDYMKKNKKYSITLEDCEKIAEKFDVKISGKVMEDKVQKEEFVENVKSETMARFIKEVTINDGIAKDIALDEDAMQRVEDNLKAKLEEKPGTKENERISPEERNGIFNAIKCIEDKRHEIQGREKLHVFSNLNQEEQQKVNIELVNAMDEAVVAKQVTKLNREQIVDTMKNAINMEGSINRQQPIKEFKPIIKKVEKIRDLDEISRSNNGGPIYEDVGNLVESMIHNTKITNRND